MLNRSGYTRDGHYGSYLEYNIRYTVRDGHYGSYLEYNIRYTVGKIEVGGGVVIVGGGFVKRGVRPNWLRACGTQEARTESRPLPF